MWRNWNPYALSLGIFTGVAAVENSMEGPQKWKLEVLSDPAIPLLGIYPKELEVLKRYLHTHVHNCTIQNSQGVEATQMPIDGRMDKENGVCTYTGILFSLKKKRNGVICSEVDGVRVCHTEWSKSEREKQILYANTYTWNLKKKRFWWT